MNLNEFFEAAEKINLRIEIPKHQSPLSHSLSNEALFQLPLLAMTILAISKGRSKPEISEIGQLVGECLERTVAGFKGSSQDIGWSANLRIRTIKALTFLETAGLAEVDKRTREIFPTEKGRMVYEVAAEGETSLALSLQTIERSYQNIRAEFKIQGEVN
jgi:hypothetical protein